MTYSLFISINNGHIIRFFRLAACNLNKPRSVTVIALTLWKERTKKKAYVIFALLRSNTPSTVVSYLITNLMVEPSCDISIKSIHARVISVWGVSKLASFRSFLEKTLEKTRPPRYLGCTQENYQKLIGL